MTEAILYDKLPNNKIRCNLCAHRCKISESHIGICGVRKNLNGQLFALNYGKLIAQHVDPIEKKPLYHFYPGSKVYSIATVGCNFKCAFCQNYEIAQLPVIENRVVGQDVAPEEIVDQAIRRDCKSIAYTYTEPTIFYEYAFDVAQLAYKASLKNIFITNGYITPEALRKIAPCLDAVNVDLKSFSNDFYKKICKAKLQPVLDALRLMKQLGIWIEVTTLVIPTFNDSYEELQSIAEFILGLGAETPWHVSAFYPAYKFEDVAPTSRQLLYRAWEIAQSVGLRYVYIGNLGEQEFATTYCYNCGMALIRRTFSAVTENHLNKGRCPFCNVKIDGVGLETEIANHEQLIDNTR